MSAAVRVLCALGFLACWGTGLLAWVTMVAANIRSFQGTPLDQRRVSIFNGAWVTAKLAGRTRISTAEAARWRRIGRWSLAAFLGSCAAMFVFGYFAHFEIRPWP